MSRIKMLISQASFISTGIFLGVGIAQLIYHLIGDVYAPEWYFILSVLCTSVIFSLPSLFLVGDNVKNFKLKLAIHFVILFIAVSFLGWLFGWYTNLLGYAIVIGIFVFVYAFTWILMMWIYMKDDKAINSALDAIRDKE
ncbi:MAG: DUF3021 family protein [Clostridiales bacterium]|nr:DUF3021 family protein [Clostridiales bacterium]